MVVLLAHLRETGYCSPAHLQFIYQQRKIAFSMEIENLYAQLLLAPGNRQRRFCADGKDRLELSQASKSVGSAVMAWELRHQWSTRSIMPLAA
ncbi:MAG: hypothetical protein ACREFR_07645 [Limisphaerales bacterium]